MKHLRRTLPAFLTAFLLLAAACESEALLGPDAPQGIDGLALIGPQCPVQSLENPCPDLPYQAWIKVRTEAGRFITRIQSDEDGRFRVGLRAGSYVLDPESGNPFPVASEIEVEVEEEVFTQVTVSFDTGIR